MAFKVSDPIQFLGNRVKGNLDDRFGPYNFDTDINTTLQNIINNLKTGLANLLAKGLKVGIIIDNKIVEYVFQGDPSSPTISDFEQIVNPEDLEYSDGTSFLNDGKIDIDTLKLKNIPNLNSASVVGVGNYYVISNNTPWDNNTLNTPFYNINGRILSIYTNISSSGDNTIGGFSQALITRYNILENKQLNISVFNINNSINGYLSIDSAYKFKIPLITTSTDTSVNVEDGIESGAIISSANNKYLIRISLPSLTEQASDYRVVLSFSNLLDLSSKVDKVQNANGNLPKFDSNGNLVNSGISASSIITSHQDISGKADKVNNAIANDFAALDGNGNLIDSGKKSSDFATSTSVSTIQGNYVKTTTSSIDPVTDPSFDPASDCVRVDTNQNLTSAQQQMGRNNINAINGDDLKTINGYQLVGSGNIVIGGSGGTSDYSQLSNKPSINGVELSGNKTNSQLGIPTKTSDLTNDSGFLTSESEPAFNSSVAKDITDTDISNWNDKVSTTNVASKIYGTTTTGEQTTYKMASVASALTIAFRGPNGVLAVGTPTDDTHATTKKYVDDNLATKQDTLVSGTNIKTINNQSILGSGNITIEGGSGGTTTKQIVFNDFVKGGFTTAVNDTAGNMRSMYPLNADEVEGASCATAQLTVGVFGGSWKRLSSDTVAQGEQWSNPHAAGARYVMLTVSGNTVPTVTLTIGSHVDLVKLSDVEFCGSNLFALFAEHQLMSDASFIDGSTTIWSKQGGTANEFVDGVQGATFGRAMHLSKTGSASTWVGKLPKSGYKPTLTTGHNYMVAWRGRMNSFSREQDNSNMNNQIYETAGLDVLFLAKDVRNTITEVTDGFVNVVDTVYATDSGVKDISIGFTYGLNRNIGTFDAHVDRCDIIDLSSLYRVPTVRELQWAYRVFVMFMLGTPSAEIEALLHQRHMADADIYIPAGQARRVFLNEARKTLDEIGVTGYKYSNPSGTDNGKYGSTADYNRISCDGMARAAVQMAGHPDLLRKVAQRRITLHALRGTKVVNLPAWANYMGGSERGANADQDADSKALGEAYEIVMGKGGNWGSSRTDSDGSGIVGNTATAVYLCRSKKYPGRVMVGVVHFGAGDVSPYSDLINVFDQLEGKTGAVEPTAVHAAAGYVPDMPSSCRYIDFLEYKKDASVAFNTASMIKFFTAVVIDRWLKPGDVVTYAPDCVLPGGSAISGKQVGDKYLYEEIMPAAMMGSDNEMFYAMATAAGKKMVLSRMDSTMID